MRRIDPAVIRKILNHLQEKLPLNAGVQIANPRAPPQAGLFGWFSARDSEKISAALGMQSGINSLPLVVGVMQ